MEPVPPTPPYRSGREAATTKVLVVFDAASHLPQAPSLNSLLERGQNLNADILQLSLTFRCYAVIVTADICKAYLQISIRPEDRDALHFLWVQEESIQSMSPSIEESIHSVSPRIE